ncbi:O-antigen translocase [Photobacterium leiognathi]|uniref:O-antigen translocase n=1 Tax=Photobacterium leiognathi TaxID=553611 RepID=UPI002734CFB7|nr:O-antigen translocase [Photobacterium leiognathi]
MSSTALLTFIRMLSGFIIAKVLATYTGTVGVAYLGQYQSFSSAINNIVNSPVQNGLVKYTREFKGDNFNYCESWWRASTYWVSIFIIIFLPVGVFFSNEISKFIFNDRAYYWVINITFICIPFSVLGVLIKSVLNGLEEYNKFVYRGIISVIISTMIIIYLIYTYNITGALIAVAVQPSIMGVTILILSIKEPWMKFKFWFGRTSKESKYGIRNFIFMGLVSAILTPISLMLIRNIIAGNLSWEDVGLWQATWKISEAYLSVISMSLTTYFIPKLTSFNSKKEIKEEIKNALKLILPICIILCLIIYIFRDLIVITLFSKEFYQARELFSFQLVGDVLKVISWFFICLLIAKGKTKIFILNEVIYSISFVMLSYFFVLFYGLKGVVISYFIVNLILLAGFTIYFYKFYLSDNNERKTKI